MAGHIFTMQATTTHATYVIPPECIGRLCRFKTTTKAVCVVFGLSGVEADTAAFSSNGSGTLTANAKSGFIVSEYEAVYFMIPAAATHFSVEALADTAVWSLEPVAELTL
jgi:hypothetical protein